MNDWITVKENKEKMRKNIYRIEQYLILFLPRNLTNNITLIVIYYLRYSHE